MTLLSGPSDLIQASSGFPGLQAAIPGGYPGVSRVQLRGFLGALTTSYRTVWSIGSGTYAQITSAVAMEVVSNSANDTAAGTGARTVVVQYLDANYAVVNETVTLNGTTPVALSSTAISVNSAYVATAGSGLKNAGAIDVRTVSGSTQKLRITTAVGAGLSKGNDFIYTIPANYVGILKSIYFSGATITGDLTVSLQSTTSAGIQSVEAIGKTSLSNTGFNPAVGSIELGAGLYLAEKTNIELEAIVTAGVGSLVATAELYLLKKGTCPWVAA